MRDRPTGSAGYQDPLISIRDGELVIGRHYFPTGAKRIRLAAITGIEQYAMTKATGRWRTWGSGNLVHWFNLDPGRGHKQQAFVVDLGRRPKPVVTPDDPDAFRAVMEAGIPTSTGAPRRRRSTTVNRSRRLAGLAATALLVLAGCGSPASTGAAPAGRSAASADSAAPSTVPASARPGPIRLHGQVAFTSDRHHNVDLYLLDLPGGRLRRLTSNSAADLSPIWAPDGGRLAFRSDRDGNDEVYVMNADGSRQHNLTRNPASDYSPAWSPDGRRIAFATARADPTGNDLWLMDADGSHPRPLVQQDGIDEYPVWSPDGSRLAFGCTLGRILPSQVGDFEVCVVNADGSGLRRITDAAGISAAGGWTPDGQRIVFDSSRDQDPDGVSACGDLYLVDADGAHLTRLTNGPASDCRPSFTPDGRHILFSSDRANPGGDSDLYAMNSDGSAITRLTHAPSEEQEPDFTPCKGACP